MKDSVIQPNSIPISGEMHLEGGEAFIPKEMVVGMITALLADRVDEDGRLLPLEEFPRDITGGGMKRLAPTLRSDLVLPPQESLISLENGRKVLHSWSFDSEGELYTRLAQTQKVTLDASTIHQLKQAEAELGRAVESSSRYTISQNEKQINDSYRIKSLADTSPDFTPIRIYVPSGIVGAETTRRVVEAGASFDYAKIWVPDLREGAQSFRNDTPILEVVSFSQLHSTIKVLRELYSSNRIAVNENRPLVGMVLEDLPGVYIGQARPGTSFNGVMSKLFAPPIVQACNNLPVRAGDHITDKLLDEAAERARELAMSRTEPLGIDPVNHAFLKGQPIEEIVRTIRDAR